MLTAMPGGFPSVGCPSLPPRAFEALTGQPCCELTSLPRLWEHSGLTCLPVLAPVGPPSCAGPSWTPFLCTHSPQLVSYSSPSFAPSLVIRSHVCPCVPMCSIRPVPAAFLWNPLLMKTKIIEAGVAELCWKLHLGQNILCSVSLTPPHNPRKQVLLLSSSYRQGP